MSQVFDVVAVELNINEKPQQMNGVLDEQPD